MRRFITGNDYEQGYLIGASLKDAGKKSFGVAKIEDSATIRDILARLSSLAI